MKRWLLLLYFPLSSYAQCDLELLDFDVVAGTVTVAFNNTENCGGTAGPDGIAEIQFGFQALDDDCNAINAGWDFPSGFSISDGSAHPGWIYSATTSESSNNWTNLYDDAIDAPYYTGDTVVFPIYNSYQSDCVDGPYAAQLYCNVEGCIQHWLSLGLSIQVVIWQISFGPTMYAEDGGWAEVGANGDGSNWGSGVYDDQNFEDNWLVVGGCGEPLPEVIVDTVYIELPPDTVIVLEYDTTYIYVTDTVVEYDTTYIYVTDTVLEYDTVYVQLPPITVYDTITVPINWYFYDTTYVTIVDTIVVEVDCVTGEECLEVIECPVYIPNSFTPDNDGVNDSWRVVATEDCWDNVEISVYSRWGDMVWLSNSLEKQWDGGYTRSMVRDDVYSYRFIARNKYTYQWVERLGHIVVLR